VNISNASPLWVSAIDLNNVLSDLGGLARPREMHWWTYLRFRRAQRLQKRCQWDESCNRDLGGEQHLERNAIRA
jgi:hypothetical protein